MYMFELITVTVVLGVVSSQTTTIVAPDYLHQAASQKVYDATHRKWIVNRVMSDNAALFDSIMGTLTCGAAPACPEAGCFISTCPDINPAALDEEGCTLPDMMPHDVDITPGSQVGRFFVGSTDANNNFKTQYAMKTNSTAVTMALWNQMTACYQQTGRLLLGSEYAAVSGLGSQNGELHRITLVVPRNMLESETAAQIEVAPAPRRHPTRRPVQAWPRIVTTPSPTNGVPAAAAAAVDEYYSSADAPEHVVKTLIKLHHLKSTGKNFFF